MQWGKGAGGIGDDFDEGSKNEGRYTRGALIVPYRVRGFWGGFHRIPAKKLIHNPKNERIGRDDHIFYRITIQAGGRQRAIKRI